MNTRFRCRKLTKEHNHLCCRELVLGTSHSLPRAGDGARSLESSRTGDTPIRLDSCGLMAEHTRLDYRELKVELARSKFTLAIASKWWEYSP